MPVHKHSGRGALKWTHLPKTEGSPLRKKNSFPHVFVISTATSLDLVLIKKTIVLLCLKPVVMIVQVQVPLGLLFANVKWSLWYPSWVLQRAWDDLHWLQQRMISLWAVLQEIKGKFKKEYIELHSGVSSALTKCKQFKLQWLVLEGFCPARANYPCLTGNCSAINQ